MTKDLHDPRCTESFDPRNISQTAIWRVCSLTAALAVIALVWLVVLPMVAAMPTVATHIEQQQQLGVDPSAMFYTELEIMPAVAHRSERLYDTNKPRFWRSTGAVSPQVMSP